MAIDTSKWLYRIAVKNEDGTYTAYDDLYRNPVYARQAVNKFEEEDKADGCYVENSYEIQVRSSATSDDWHTFVRKPKEKHNGKTVTIRLPDELYEAFREKTDAMGISANSVMRILMQQWINGNNDLLK